MENLNLGIILRHGPHSDAVSDSSGSNYSSDSEALDYDRETRPAAGSPCSADNGASPGNREENGARSRDGTDHEPHHHHHHHKANRSEDDDDIATVGQSESVTMNDRALHHRRRFDPHDDSASPRRYWDAMFYPEVYMPVFYALRITFLVALPLGILSRHPKTMGKFPAHVVLSLWGVVDCKYTFGEQLAQSIVSYQVGIWMGLWGGLNNIWGLLAHRSAWWCSVLFSCFIMSLLGDVRAKRLLVLQTVMILQMANLPGGTELDYPIRVGRDMIMSTTFSLFQVLFPLRSIAKDCDGMTAGAWKHVHRILRSSTRACWADDPIDRALALADCSTEPLQHYFTIIDSKLFFITYEFWESTLRLELRRERVTVLKNIITRIHALTDTSRSLVTNRVLNIVKGKEKPVSRTLSVAPGKRRPSPLTSAKSAPPSPVFLQGTEANGDRADNAHSPYGAHRRRRRTQDLDGDAADEYPMEGLSNSGEEEDTRRRGARGTAGASRRQYQDLLMDGGDDVDGAMGGQDLDNAGRPMPPSMKPRPMSNDMHMWNITKELLHQPIENFFAALQDVFEGLSKYLNPKDVAAHVPFQALRDASNELQSALNQIHFEILIKGGKEVDPMQYTSTIFYHLMLIETAQVVLDYGDLMINFDRSRYKSQWLRIWEFFFYDYWRDFWVELPKRMTLATPRDVRIVKDAIKMSCAYGVGVMFTEYTDPENVYFFGMAILMGVGWPTVGDTMVASVYRVTGMALACSIAYIAVWHTNNLTQELAISLAGVLIALLFRDQPPYSHTAQYCSMLVITALNSAGTKLVLLARVVSNCFTVMTYYAIVVFLFPTDVMKVTFAAEVCAIDMIAERFSRLVMVMQNPLSFTDKDHLDAVQTEVRLIGNMTKPMWGQLMVLGAWLPKAANEPAVRGEPYPIGHMRNVFSSLRRLASATDVLHAAVALLFRTRMEGALPTALHMYLGLLPVLRKIDRRARQVLRDFVDAMYRPYEWSAEAATRNFSRFLALNEDLHTVFNDSHRRHTEALRENFRNSVVNRTFAHAARNFMGNASSFRGGGGGGDGGGSSPGAAAANMVLNENASFASRREVQKALEAQQQQQAQLPPNAPNQASMTTSEMVDRLQRASAAPSPVAGGVVSPAVMPTRSASSASTARSIGSGIEALDDPSKEPISREVAQRLMTSFAFPAREQTGTVDHPLCMPADDGAAPASGSARPSVHAPYGTPATGDLEAALRPMQELAEEEEYHAFITDNVDAQENFSLRSDVNKVITILVATDMFFGEAERLVKTMYAINHYARTRVTPPAWYRAQQRAKDSHS